MEVLVKMTNKEKLSMEELQKGMKTYTENKLQKNYYQLKNEYHALENSYGLANSQETDEFSKKLLFVGSFILTGFCSDFLLTLLEDWSEPTNTLESLKLQCSNVLPHAKPLTNWSEEEKAVLSGLNFTYEKAYWLLITATSDYYSKDAFLLNKSVLASGGNPFALAPFIFGQTQFILYNNRFVAWDLTSIMTVHNKHQESLDLNVHWDKLAEDQQAYIKDLTSSNTVDEFKVKRGDNIKNFTKATEI